MIQISFMWNYVKTPTKHIIYVKVDLGFHGPKISFGFFQQNLFYPYSFAKKKI